jgi:hypothetical protein
MFHLPSFTGSIASDNFDFFYIKIEEEEEEMAEGEM